MSLVLGGNRRKRHRRHHSDELLAAVDVVGCASQRRIDHQVHGKRGDVFWPDDPSDWKCRSQFVAAVLQLITEQGSRQRGVDEACGDEVDANRCEFQGECRGERRQRGGGGCTIPRR